MDSTKKEHSKWLVVSILGVVFLSIVAVQVQPGSSEVTPQKSWEEVAAELAASGQIPPRKISLEKVSANLPAFMEKDPVETIDAINLGVTEATPRIEAICISGNFQPCAYVGGKLVREGDTVNGFKILRIYPNKVEFGKNGNTVVGVFPDKRRPAKPEPDKFLQKQVSYKSSSNYQIQHGLPTYSSPHIAENGSYYGEISENTGRAKTVYVRGYYRKDGTYVRSHYRSRPR